MSRSLTSLVLALSLLVSWPLMSAENDSSFQLEQEWSGLLSSIKRASSSLSGIEDSLSEIESLQQQNEQLRLEREQLLNERAQILQQQSATLADLQSTISDLRLSISVSEERARTKLWRTRAIGAGAALLALLAGVIWGSVK